MWSLAGCFDASGSFVQSACQLPLVHLGMCVLEAPLVCAEGLNPAPHIHEQMTTSNYGYDIAYNFTHNNIMLEHNAMNNMNTVAHMDVHNTQY